MRRSIFHKRIPSVLGFLLIGIGIVTSSWFLQTGVLFPTEAASGSTPQNIRISNVTDTSFTISYTTTDAVIGYALYDTATTKESIRVTDTRDTSGTPTASSIHFITLSNLNPGTAINYKIVSGNKEYLKAGNEPFSFTVPASLSSPPSPELSLSGTVQLQGATPGIVYVSVSDSQVISALTTDEGSFNISYPNLRSRDFASPASFSDTSNATLLITNGVLSSKVTSLLSESNPLPTISLSQNYDFLVGSTTTGSFDGSASADLLGFPSITAEDPDETSTPEIISPESNEGFSDQRPQFKGRALPDEEVEIIIHSDQEIKASVKANKSGSWTYRPTTPLVPGEHTLTIRTRDSFGILQELKQSFVVYAEGSQFTDPSVSPVKSPTPTQLPSPSITPTGTQAPSPTATSTPTPTLAITPTSIPTLATTPTVSISPVEPPPDAGSPALIFASIAGIATIGVGLFVLFMSRGGAF